MAVALAEVAHPNAGQTEGVFLGFKAKLQTVTFDSSYLTTGEVVTAAQLGWSYLLGAIQLTGGIATPTGTLSATLIVRPNAAGTQLTLQAQETAATVDTPHKEMSSATDLSTYSGVVIFIGY